MTNMNPTQPTEDKDWRSTIESFLKIHHSDKELEVIVSLIDVALSTAYSKGKQDEREAVKIAVEAMRPLKIDDPSGDYGVALTNVLDLLTEKK